MVRCWVDGRGYMLHSVTVTILRVASLRLSLGEKVILCFTLQSSETATKIYRSNSMQHIYIGLQRLSVIF
jgi:hypothetical protein